MLIDSVPCLEQLGDLLWVLSARVEHPEPSLYPDVVQLYLDLWVGVHLIGLESNA